jgi:hypothetical protein
VAIGSTALGCRRTRRLGPPRVPRCRSGASRDTRTAVLRWARMQLSSRKSPRQTTHGNHDRADQHDRQCARNRHAMRAHFVADAHAVIIRPQTASTTSEDGKRNSGGARIEDVLLACADQADQEPAQSLAA